MGTGLAGKGAGQREFYRVIPHADGPAEVRELGQFNGKGPEPVRVLRHILWVHEQ